MAKTEVREVETINFGESSIKVEDASDAVKGLVYHYNRANQKDQDVTDELVLIRTAKESILAQIRVQLEKEQTEANAPANEAEVNKDVVTNTLAVN